MVITVFMQILVTLYTRVKFVNDLLVDDDEEEEF